jgi:hypothetical protein
MLGAVIGEMWLPSAPSLTEPGLACLGVYPMSLLPFPVPVNDFP